MAGLHRPGRDDRMRRGELLALRWDDVDLAGETVRVRNTASQLSKSRKNRALPLLPEVADLLGRP